MTKTPITLQDLKRKLYVKAKADPSWRFWGLYVHVCQRETLRAAYEMIVGPGTVSESVVTVTAGDWR